MKNIKIHTWIFIFFNSMQYVLGIASVAVLFGAYFLDTTTLQSKHGEVYLAVGGAVWLLLILFAIMVKILRFVSGSQFDDYE